MDNLSNVCEPLVLTSSSNSNRAVTLLVSLLLIMRGAIVLEKLYWLVEQVACLEESGDVRSDVAGLSAS
jgi:hypothetical protein